MNQDSTVTDELSARVVTYDDGVYNLVLSDTETEEGTTLRVSREEAKRVCGLLDAELPEVEPTPPEQWG